MIMEEKLHKPLGLEGKETTKYHYLQENYKINWKNKGNKKINMYTRRTL
jgi:hypothetical protein